MSAEKPRAGTILNQGSLCWPGWCLGLGRMRPEGCPGRPGPGRGRLGRGRKGLGPRLRALEASLGRQGPGRRAHGPSRRAPTPPRRIPMPSRRSPMPSRRAPMPRRRAPMPSRRSPMPSRIAFTIAGRGRLKGAASGAIRGYRWGIVRRPACALCGAGPDSSWLCGTAPSFDSNVSDLTTDAHGLSGGVRQAIRAASDSRLVRFCGGHPWVRSSRPTP